MDKIRKSKIIGLVFMLALVIGMLVSVIVHHNRMDACNDRGMFYTSELECVDVPSHCRLLDAENKMYCEVEMNYSGGITW